jgi:ribonucleotide monophosphatase NagD (HAD superfamily)
MLNTLLNVHIKDTFIFDIDLSRKPFAVVSSFDPHINYVKIMKAVNYLKDTNVHFIVTNEDLTFPGPNPSIFW